MSWNLEDHILDHAAIVSNNLPSYFNLADDKNIHFTFSIDKSQLIINHNCKSQKDIDIVMSKFFEDLKEYEYITSIYTIGSIRNVPLWHEPDEFGPTEGCGRKAT